MIVFDYIIFEIIINIITVIAMTYGTNNSYNFAFHVLLDSDQLLYL